MKNDVLEYQVLSILRNRAQYKKIGNLITEELFTDERTKRLFKLIIRQHSKGNGKFLNYDTMKSIIDTYIKEDDRNRYMIVLKKLKKYYVKGQSTIDILVKRFIQVQYLLATAQECINQVQNGEDADFERIEQTFSKAKRLISTSYEDIGVDYFTGFESRFEEIRTEKRLPTGISKRIDKAIEGGLAAGEIGLVIAPTGVGKTLFLINVAYNAMAMGKMVLYITLELHTKQVEKRLSIRATERPWKELLMDRGLVFAIQRKLQSLGAGMKIKDYTSSLCSVLDIKSYIERIKDEGFHPDVVIVDHIDLMYSPRQYKEYRHEVSTTMAGLRRMGSEYGVPVWTASQANRDALKQGITRLHNVAEDIGKIQASDVAITISQTDEEKTDGVMHLILEKNRIGSGNPPITAQIDYSSLKIQSVESKKMRELADG